MHGAINLAQLLAGHDPVAFAAIPGAIAYHDNTPAHRFATVVAPAAQGEYCIAMPSRDSFDEKLAAAGLTHVLAEINPVSAETPVRILEGFSCGGYDFDCVAVLSPIAANQYEYENDFLNSVSFVAFPLYRCELTGDESVELISLIRRDFLDSLNWKRSPSPKISMAFQNTRTKGQSTRKAPGLAHLRDALVEIENMIGGNDSWIEVRNYVGRQVRIEWSAGRYIVMLPNQSSQELDKSEVINLVMRFALRNES